MILKVTVKKQSFKQSFPENPFETVIVWKSIAELSTVISIPIIN